MSVIVEKICVVCQKDVSGERRVKDPQGRYYCQPCSQRIQERAPAAPAERTPAAPPMDDYGELELAPVAEPVKPRRAMTLVPAIKGVAPLPLGGGPPCPCCEKELGVGAKICVDCGIKVPSGKPMITALGRDENALYTNAESIIRPLSWLLRFGLYPIASEAYAIKKPIAIWVIAILTTLVSIGFFIDLRTEGDHATAMSLVLWPPRESVSDQEALAFYQLHAHDNEGERMRQLGKDLPPGVGTTDDERAAAAARFMLENSTQGEFRWYQLFTNTLLHDPNSIFGFIMHLGGNMLFLLIFGTRVNALIGNLKMAILYPLLGAAASGAQLLFHVGKAAPALGASGAIMGLAGMYLIFFPVHRVYMAFWLKIFWRIPTWIKIWPTRGFWVLFFYLSFDVASTLLRSKDGVAHWAHLGGFIAGVAVALVLLISRMQSANHGDLLSVLLGKRSWLLIGKPARTVFTGVLPR